MMTSNPFRKISYLHSWIRPRCSQPPTTNQLVGEFDNAADTIGLSVTKYSRLVPSATEGFAAVRGEQSLRARPISILILGTSYVSTQTRGTARRGGPEKMANELATYVVEIGSPLVVMAD
jgi:hypothetical protein